MAKSFNSKVTEKFQAPLNPGKSSPVTPDGVRRKQKMLPYERPKYRNAYAGDEDSDY